MKSRFLATIVAVSVLVTAAEAVKVSGQEPGPAGRRAANMGMPGERGELEEASRASNEVSRFLAQPKLAEAIAAARADIKMADQARSNANEFLASHGVQVPPGINASFESSSDAAARKRIEIKVSCCPLNIEIIIYL